MEISSTLVKLSAVVVIFLSSETIRYVRLYDTNPYIRFNNTGMGDSIVIKPRKDLLVLVDGGPDKSILNKLTDLTPFLYKSINYVIVSHPHADHISGIIHIMNEYNVGCIIYNYKVNPASNRDNYLKQLIRIKNIPYSYVGRGYDNLPDCNIDELDELEIFYPPIIKRLPQNVNDLSLLVFYKQKNHLFVLTGDAEFALQNYYLNIIKGNEDWNPNLFSKVILKIPHQGSSDALNLDFSEYLNPDTGIILVGRNSYGHPHREVVDYYLNRNTQLFRSDFDGDLTFN